jgi:hypothetical protein
LDGVVVGKLGGGVSAATIRSRKPGGLFPSKNSQVVSPSPNSTLYRKMVLASPKSPERERRGSRGRQQSFAGKNNAEGRSFFSF